MNNNTPKKKRIKVTDKFTFTQTDYAGKICGIYLRCSSDDFKTDHEKKESLLVQRAAGIKNANDHKWQYKIYENDDVISGTLDDEDNPKLVELKNDIKNGLLHTLTCRDMSRLFRNEANWHGWVWNVFYKMGVDFQCWDEDVNIKTPDGLMLAGFKAGQNQRMPVKSAKDSMRSKQSKFEKGILLSKPAFGYRIIKDEEGNRKGVHHKIEAQIIEEIFQRFARGEGVQKCLKWLHTQDIPSRQKTVNKKPVTGKQIKKDTTNILRWIHNPIYKGVQTYNGEVNKTPYTPIVTPALWAEANNQNAARAEKSRSRKNAGNINAFIGVVKCGFCYKNIQEGKQETSPHRIHENCLCANNRTCKTVNGERIDIHYKTYTCGTRHKYGLKTCPESRTLSASMLDDFFKHTVGELIAANIGQTDTQDTRTGELTLLLENKTTLIIKHKKTIEKALSSLSNDVIDAKDYATIKRNNLETIEKLEADILKLKEQIAGLDIKDVARALNDLRDWDTLTTEQKRHGLKRIFDKILVYKNHAEIYFKFSDFIHTRHAIKFISRKGYVISRNQLCQVWNSELSEMEDEERPVDWQTLWGIVQSGQSINQPPESDSVKALKNIENFLEKESSEMRKVIART